MRTQLAKWEGTSDVFRATFARYGSRTLTNGGKTLTVLLIALTDARGSFVADHLWFSEYKPFMPLMMESGQRIQFRATVETYQRKRDSQVDYRMVGVTGVHKVLRSR